jgi:DHA2 family multidrug resistance protein-like MFS transporter
MAAGSRRWWSLFAIAAATLVVGLDMTVLNLALPTLSRDLHASTGDLQWFSDAYSLVLAAVLLPAGLLGDRYGRRKVMIISLAIFGASSAWCAYADSTGQLIAARAVLGLGAAALIPLSLAMLPVLFEPAERPKAIAVMMIATFIAYPAGPLVGGWFLDYFWWGSVFLINLPVAVIAIIAVAVLVPESRSETKHPIDLIGMVISGIGLVCLTYGFIRAGEDSWGNGVALGALGAGVVILAGFVAWERRLGAGGSASPLVDLGLFRSAGFAWGAALIALMAFAMFGILFSTPQYFQAVRGVSPFGSGLRLLPLIGALVLAMIAGGRLQTPPKGPDGRPVGPPRVSSRVLVAVGFLTMGISTVLGAFTTISSSTLFIAVWFAVAGFGLGLAMPTAMNAALSALLIQRVGSGSALLSAMRQVGAVVGVAVLGTVISSAYHSGIDVSGLAAQAVHNARESVVGGVATAQALNDPALLSSVHKAFTQGIDEMLWVCAGISVVGTLAALLFLPRERPAAAVAPPAPAPSESVHGQVAGSLSEGVSRERS